MKEPPVQDAGLPLVDVRVTLPGTGFDEALRGTGQLLAACLACHRIEWRGAQAAADGRAIWHFRAPDAESVRIALRQAAVPFEAVSAVPVLDSTERS